MKHGEGSTDSPKLSLLAISCNITAISWLPSWILLFSQQHAYLGVAHFFTAGLFWIRSSVRDRDSQIFSIVDVVVTVLL